MIALAPEPPPSTEDFLSVVSASLHLDGWTIRTLPLSGHFMEWLEHRLFHWKCSNPASADLDQLSGLIDALHQQIMNAPREGGGGSPSGRGNF